MGMGMGMAGSGATGEEKELWPEDKVPIPTRYTQGSS